MILRLKRKTKFLLTILIIVPVISAGAVYLIKPVQGATCNWTAGSGAWETGSNWSCGAAPTSADDAVIDANVTVTINTTTTINSLILGNSDGTTTPTLNFNYDAISNGALILDDGDMTIYANANITHTIASGGTIVGRVNIDIQTGNGTLDGTIDIDSKGYPSGYGPSNGTNGNNNEGGGGAGLGGEGGNGESGRAGGISYNYSETFSPATLGSGGGYAGWGSTSYGHGGGSLTLSVSGILTIDGTISANGQNGAAQATDRADGGGAGGSIYIITNTFAGSGNLNSNGGDGGNSSSADGGGGGGGRIAIEYVNNSFSGNIQSYGGFGPDGAQNGAAGTILKKASIQTYGDLYIDNSGITNEARTSLGTNTFDNVTITAAYLSHRQNTTSEEYKLDLTILNSLIINTGGSIDVSNRGYQQSSGPGTGVIGNEDDGAGGGAHGGEGGQGNSGYNGGINYGNIATPTTIGSGGGYAGWGTSIYAHGGGAAKLTVLGSLIVDGTITANGQNGVGQATDRADGGGAAGSIYIITDTITGSGNITANGGNGGNQTSADGGGGGGGRIAIVYTTNTLSGNIQAHGGTGPDGAQDGAAGTIFQKSAAQTYGNLLVDNTGGTQDNKTVLSTNTFDNMTINNADVSHQRNTTTETYKLNLTIKNNLTINSNSKLNLDEDGYSQTTGTGQGTDGTNSNGGGGAGHAGIGGNGNAGASGGGTYGTSTNPYTIGSGGGYAGYQDIYGGRGAGAGRIIVEGILTVNGGITANGGNGIERYTDRAGGGGSGGSLWITAEILTGSGTISANGGNGGNTSTADGGGGGGGYISLEWISSNTWSGNTLNSANAAVGGTGPDSATDGGDGTVTVNQLSTGYVTNLDSGLNSVLTSDWATDMEQSGNATAGYKGIGITNNSSNRIAEFTIKLDGDIDWTNVSGGTNISQNKAFFHVPGGFPSIAGYDSSYPTYALYVPKGTGTRVGVCPGVSTLNDVHSGCSGLVYYTPEDSNVEIVNIDNMNYWKVSGLTSTGGFSAVDNMTDTMTRLQVNTASDHEIVFTTLNGIDLSTDTITVEFDPSSQSWDLGSIALGDIDLEDDGTDVTLAASASAGVWGVNINTTTDIITFTAPTDAGADEIADDSVITIKIGTNADGGSNQIINPATAGQYEIEIRMNTTASEYAFVEVAIVDDDTVNVNSYIDSFILFDIDTVHTNLDCDASGGTSPCNSHSNSSDSSGYTVDLGEMSSLSVNDSGDSVLHADGLTGSINYIFFDLSTNANSGAVVTVVSTNGALNGSGTNTIPSVNNDGNGVTISAGDGAYGIREVSNSAIAGTFTIAGDYNGSSSVYGECSTSATQIFSTTSSPMDTGRLQMAVGASPDSSDGTGTYTDTLTFIVTSTF